MKTYLTGQYVTLLRNGLKSLSISDICDIYCPTRRDLYLKKGKNKPKDVKQRGTWGSIAGSIIEESLIDIFDECKKNSIKPNYKNISNIIKPVLDRIKEKNKRHLDRLDKLKIHEGESSDWFLNLLMQNGKMEYIYKNIHEILSTEDDVELDDIDIKISELNPNPLQIGISKKIIPDILMEKSNTIGDIKSGISGFKDLFLLTCTGYALAYENFKPKNNMDYGVIIYFPTRSSRYAKPISFVQIYIFLIDDTLRDYFLQQRNRSYNIIKDENIPPFPDNKDFCTNCLYLNICTKDGLTI